MNPISALPSVLSIGEPQVAVNLTMVPLLRREPPALAYLTFPAALKQGSVEVTELGDGGSVPEVKVDNRGDLPVLFLDGEALVGAKQNRVLNLSVLVPARATTVIPVSCVEAGRWSPRSRAFQEGESLHFVHARASRVAAVSASMACGNGRRSNQSAVWDDVSEYRTHFAADAPTGAMQDILRKVRHSVDDLLGALRRVPDQAGAAFLLDGKLVGLDLLGAPATFDDLYDKIVRSYAIEALRAPTPSDREPKRARQRANAADPATIVREALERLAAEPWSDHSAIGIGTDLRLSSPGWDAAALAHEADVIHLAAFPRRVQVIDVLHSPSSPDRDPGRRA
jgi:hypothetical protein